MGLTKRAELYKIGFPDDYNIKLSIKRNSASM